MPNLKERNLFISHVWEYSSHYNKVVDWFDEANNFKWKNYSVPVDNPIKTDTTTEIEKRITNKIKLSHGIVILSGMYVNHSSWIDYEIDEALRLNKVIIGVKPWGNEKLPKKVKDNAETVVNWQQASVVQAVRDYVRV